MAPSAPTLFSTTTGWPRVSESGCATMRVMTSAAPPGGNGTTMRMGLAGYCAAAGIAMRPKTPAAARTRINICMVRIMFMLVLPLRFIASPGLLRVEASGASRVTPIDELLLKESTQLAGRRTAGLEALFFKLFAYLRALQDDVHLAREPLHDILWRFRRREQACPRNKGKAWHSRFGDRRHVRKQRAPLWEQRRECTKPTFLY